MEFDTNIQAMAKEALLPKSVDIVLGSNVLALRLLGNAKKWRGTKLEKTIQHTAPTTGGSFSGYDLFDTTSSDTKIKLSFDLRGYYQSIILSGMEIDVTSASESSVDLVVNAIEEGTNAMADAIGTILYGTGTGNGNKDFLGLGAVVDDGGEVATYGGQTRASYTGLQANETDVGGALTLAGMATMYSSCSSGSEKPTLIVTTEAIWDDYEALNQPYLQNNMDGYRQVTMKGMTPREALKGETGFDALFFRGTPVVADEKATSGTMWFLNEKHLAFYSLESKMPGYSKISVGGNKTIEGEYGNQPSKNLAFNWSGFKQPVNQYAEIGQVILEGNLVSFHPRRHGVLNTIS